MSKNTIIISLCTGLAIISLTFVVQAKNEEGSSLYTGGAFLVE